MKTVPDNFGLTKTDPILKTESVSLRWTDSCNRPIQLIVNADDYGYYPCVSRGILKAVAAGTVTATGILANGPQLESQISWLSGYENLDLGIHLNLTSCDPLTSGMAGKLSKWEGKFPGVFGMTGEILSGRIGLECVQTEWRTQIETVLRYGINPVFLNSHEHIHMLPKLFTLAQQLAKEYHIPHLRLTRAEWMSPFGFSSGLRNVLLQAMESFNSLRSDKGVPLFIGLSRSGKLDFAYLKKRFASLKPGDTYELMCHPGHFDPAEIADSRLLSYHAWEDELDLLTSPGIKALFGEFKIRLINYREYTANQIT